MGLQFRDLNAQTRALMLAEIDLDESEGRLFLSQRLTSVGRASYPSILREAVNGHSDDWLAAKLQSGGFLLELEPRTSRNGKRTMAKVPVTAAQTLAEGEFNRFYLRALSRQLIDGGAGALRIYRAKEVSSPRSESERKIGATVDPSQLLADLRASVGVDTALGLPPGPNSGLSAFIDLARVNA